jgi:hypothetical protein
MCIRNGAANEPPGPRGHEADGSRNALDCLLPGVANGEHGAGTVRAPAAQPELVQALRPAASETDRVAGRTA